MPDIIDIHKAVSILEEAGITFTKEQFDILFSHEKLRIDNALPNIEKAMRKICSSMMCKWSLKASFLRTDKWAVECLEKNITADSANKSIEKVYDQINMLRELGLPVGQEQMANVKATEFVYVKEKVVPLLEVTLNNLLSTSIPGVIISFCIKPKGKMTCDLAEPTSQPKSQPRKNDNVSIKTIETLAASNHPNVDCKKLQSVFDKKVTSYKYFWFYSIISILNEHDGRTIAVTDIVSKMIATAWSLVNTSKLDFGQADALPKYIEDILVNTGLQVEASQDEVFEYLKENKSIPPIRASINKLRKNVPYRFLTPWIKYVSDEQMMSDSISPQTGCPYAISTEHITIHEGWDEYIRINSDQLCSFISQSLSSYLDKFNTKQALDILPSVIKC